MRRASFPLATDSILGIHAAAGLLGVQVRELVRASVRGELSTVWDEQARYTFLAADLLRWAKAHGHLERIARRREEQKAAKGRRLVQCRPQGASLKRIRVWQPNGYVEITCTREEEATVLAWAIEHLGTADTDPLPVPEYREHRWHESYRWTAAADRRERRETKRRAGAAR
jgi:hypothetical protein